MAENEAEQRKLVVRGIDLVKPMKRRAFEREMN